MPKFNKPIIEKVSEFVWNKLRKFTIFNNYENEILTNDFETEVQAIKEQNSKFVFYRYYLPKAQKQILEDKGYLPTEKSATPLATAMLFSDYQNGVLNEWYEYAERGV